MGLHIVACCLSLIFVADFYAYLKLIMFDTTRLYGAIMMVAPFAAASALFVFARFSFGYFVGFYLYTMVLGYLWLAEFSLFRYDHLLCAISAFSCASAFLAPALFLTSPIKRRLVLSEPALDRLLSFILVLGTAVVITGATYNFRFVGLAEMYSARSELDLPAFMRYAIGITPNALLPFAFACFVTRRNHRRAAAALLLMLLCYPIALTKLTFLAPFWLLLLTLLSRFNPRIAVVLSLFLPLSTGLALSALYKSGAISYQHFIGWFGSINFRMIAFPSAAIDVYNDFFSRHDYTYFCQISFLKPFVQCPYSDPLSIVMAKNYQLGNLNASLFATEGIASVGPLLAPFAVLACGFVVALGNRLSAGLPPSFVLLSGGVFPQLLLNVPLTTTLLTNGAALLFLLWYVTPRTMFEHGAGSSLELESTNNY
ncbi:hypothetical protein [Bradyrhizobium sp. 62]|uniref:hypothetical protein n=1 Tax=Bradyrhizobium sp. 62 TaxID=1043588 RepID=UPI001FFADA28|nr:hypothetical protein [Bradyrhizobium sp. 62]